MYIINKQMRRIFNTDNLQVVLISPDDSTKIVGVMVDYEDYVVICECPSSFVARTNGKALLSHCVKVTSSSISTEQPILTFVDIVTRTGEREKRRKLTSSHARTRAGEPESVGV